MSNYLIHKLYFWQVVLSNYYMASSASGQDEPNRAPWLATRAGKMEPSCPLGTTRCIPRAKFLRKPYNKSFIDQVCSVKMTGYWPRSFFREFMGLDFVSVHKHAKKNLANIQPSWPHTWSITHTSYRPERQYKGSLNLRIHHIKSSIKKIVLKERLIFENST